MSKSTMDISNRYVSAVLVDGGRGMCGGVLISPRVVLTAGHCVCSQREVRPGEGNARSFIDKTTCAQTAAIKVMSYRSGGGANDENIIGRVRPHAQLKVLYDNKDKEVSSNADLAVIVLPTLPTGIKPIRMATEQVRYTQSVTLVGYGQESLGVGARGERRFGFNEVASIAEDGATFLVGKPIEVRRPYKPKEKFLVRQESSYSLGGDSGGPCLRERGDAMFLVGIAKTHYGGADLVQFSEYTSTFFYREWLRQEIANAERTTAD